MAARIAGDLWAGRDRAALRVVSASLSGGLRECARSEALPTHAPAGGAGRVIFTVESAIAAVAGEITAICRRPSGRWKVGGVYAVQPGRYKPHIGHIRVTALSPENVDALTASGRWEIPAGEFEAGSLVEVMAIEPAERCAACRMI